MKVIRGQKNGRTEGMSKGDANCANLPMVVGSVPDTDYALHYSHAKPDIHSPQE